MSWIQTAKVGDKVVLVDDRWDVKRRDHAWCIRPKLGEIYTIREIVDALNGIGFLLEEVRNQPADYLDSPGPVEKGFLAARFRPVQPRKTSIAIFESMLRKVGKPVEEVA